MAIARMSPVLSELAAAKERLNRLSCCEERWEAKGAMSVAEWTPSVDILESENALTINVELPGVEASDIAITVDRNVLTIKGARRTEKDARKIHYHRMERACGRFFRSFTLPAIVNISAIRAEKRNGLLTLMLPKHSSERLHGVEIDIVQQTSSDLLSNLEGEHHE